jgi:hypothetical protein
MSAQPVRILLIQSWVVATHGIRMQLVAGGFLPKITRVDFEAALVAALWRGNIDLVLSCSSTPSLPPDVVEIRMNEYGVRAPLVEVGDLETLATRARRAMAALRN